MSEMHWKDFWWLFYRDYFCRRCLFCTFKPNLTFCLHFFCVMSKNTTPVFLYWMCQTVYELNKHAGLASGCLLWISCWLLLLYVLQMVPVVMSASYIFYVVLCFQSCDVWGLPHFLWPLWQPPYLNDDVFVPYESLVPHFSIQCPTNDIFHHFYRVVVLNYLSFVNKDQTTLYCLWPLGVNILSGQFVRYTIECDPKQQKWGNV